MDDVIAGLGHDAAQEAIRSMGVLIDKHFGAVGGFSARRGMNEFMTVLPYADLAEAGEILKDFVEDFRGQGVQDISARALKRAASGGCVEFSIRVGLAQGQPIAGMDAVVESAKEQQREVARLRCDS
jgi:phospholipid/cholesterol/gamma-HCH transport system ATP-binding protein